MSTKLERSSALACLVLLCLAGPPLHADPAASHPRPAPAAPWVFPVIKGYGGVHPRPDLAAPAPGLEYRVIADVFHGSRDSSRVAGSLQRLARLVNLLSYAGVPPAHVHIVAVIEGPAGFAAFTNAAYQRRFRVDNPNLPLLRELERAGVKLMVCSQALAENGIEDGDIAPGIEITLSALTDFASYGARGYSYLRL
jgi:intracellular sulfur oxidation DsrE/DsrF family protein